MWVNRDDVDDQAVSECINALMEAFAESPEGKAYAAEHGEVEWAGHFTYYGLNYPTGDRERRKLLKRVQLRRRR